MYTDETINFVIPHHFSFIKFDFKDKILYANHPYQYLAFYLKRDYYDDNVNDYHDVNIEIFEMYFKLLDRYYRYGFLFHDFNIYYKNKLYLFKLCYNDYYVILNNNYNYKDFDNLKIINIDEMDKGEKNISEIEKWKRKVILNTEDNKTKMNLLNPYIYNSLITFVAFLKNRPHTTLVDYFVKTFKIKKFDNYKCKYEKMKMYEDRIYNKIKNKLNNIHIIINE